MPTLEQLEKQVADLKTLVSKVIGPDGKLILPVMTDKERAGFQQEVADAIPTEGVKKAVLTLLPGNGPTTSPVGGGAVVPAGPVELLSAAVRGPFILKGFEKRQQSIDVVKGGVYQVSIEVESTDGGRSYFQFVRLDGSGFGYEPLKKGVNTFKVTAPESGQRLYSIESNNGTTKFSSASLTKTV